MFQQLCNTLLVRANGLSQGPTKLNAVITSLVTHLFPHMGAQGCTYLCYYTCRVNDACPDAGELTSVGSNFRDCSPPYCFLFTNTCC